jgi:bifunctional enzyme CysN/CysC
MNQDCTTCAAPQFKIVIVGHVDHGKSTLVGRLLHDTGSFLDGKLEELHRAAESRGVPFEWASLMDALQSERDQNITIDTAQIWFRTPRRQYVLVDTPGHVEFLKNMVTGAAGADAALLLIDAEEGIRENSRRHGYVLGLLGIRQVAVVVNKMDRVSYREDRFRAIEADYLAWLESVGVTPRLFLPIAARHGDNIATRSPNMPWYDGPTVLESLDAFDAPERVSHRPLRFPVQDVYRFDDRRIVAGRVESGTVRVGDRIVFSPSGKTGTVRTIERWSAPARDAAAAGESVGLTLTEQVFVERGAVAAAVDAPPTEGTRFRGKIFWLGKRPLRIGRRYKLKLATAEADCDVVSIESVVDAATLAPVPSRSAERTVGCHEVAELTVRTRKPVAFDAFGDIAATGRFVIVDGLDIAGGGIIATAAPPPSHAREAGLHHRDPRGCVLWLTGPAEAERSTIAAELKRELFSRGRHAYVLDGDTLDGGLCSDLAFTARDRAEQMRRVGEVAKLFDAAGVICIADLILPRREERDGVRRLLPEGRFVEVRMAAAAHHPSEPPPGPEIEIPTDRLTVSESVLKILEYLRI